MFEEKFDMIIKLVLVGESSVGKTNLLLRYTENKYDPTQRPTIGMDFLSKDLLIDQRHIKVQFWDTAGQEKYKSIANSYFKMSNGVILVYDVTRRDTFEKIGKWIETIRTHAVSDVRILLVGNKIDLEENREVTVEEGRNYAKEQGVYFWETSGKTNPDNCVTMAFNLVVEECRKEVLKNELKEEGEQFERIRTESIKLNPRKDKSKERCC